ncbi:MAG: RNA-binding S4 domain-containing protein [Schwartzia sp.]|nr:RNA-binding S4 domain-containing protein [Schwartzia sp. (in: firmicutes)]
MEQVKIKTADIQLDQFLKLAGAVMTGGEVKGLVREGLVRLNGEVETARRRKIRSGDIVTIQEGKSGRSYQVAGE